jgi:hypothetical protein
LVEQPIRNRQVTGSSPVVGSIKSGNYRAVSRRVLGLVACAPNSIQSFKTITDTALVSLPEHRLLEIDVVSFAACHIPTLIVLMTPGSESS